MAPRIHVGSKVKTKRIITTDDIFPGSPTEYHVDDIPEGTVGVVVNVDMLDIGLIEVEFDELNTWMLNLALLRRG